jgi:hypothetical protein
MPIQRTNPHPPEPRLAHLADLATEPVTSPAGLRVGPVPGRGRGVFATRGFAQGDLVETAPVLVLPPSEQDRLDGTVLDWYVFGWRDTVALALGYGSLYNHAWEPNLDYRKRFDLCVIELVAICEIKAGEELTINYGASQPHRADLWAALR